MRPGLRAALLAQLCHLVAVQVHQIPRREREARSQRRSAGGRVGTGRRCQRTLADARPLGIVDVLNNRRTSVALALHRAQLPLGVVPVLIVAVVDRVARGVVAKSSQIVAGDGLNPVVGVGRAIEGLHLWHEVRPGARYRRERLQCAVAEGVVGPAAVLARVVLRSRDRGRNRRLRRRRQPIHRVVAEAPRAHHGISIAGVKRGLMKVCGLPP